MLTSKSAVLDGNTESVESANASQDSSAGTGVMSNRPHGRWGPPQFKYDTTTIKTTLQTDYG